MRNYVKFVWAKISYEVDVNPPNPPVPEKTFLFEQNDFSLASIIADTIAGLETDPRVINVSTELRGGLFLLLDKTNLVTISAGAMSAAMQNIDNGVYPAYIYSGPNNNPRSGWTDEDGVLRPAQGSEHAAGKKGKPGKVDVSVLELLELTLHQWILGETSQGRRLGGVLVPARFIDKLTAIIAKLKGGKITPDQALALFKNIR